MRKINKKSLIRLIYTYATQQYTYATLTFFVEAQKKWNYPTTRYRSNGEYSSIKNRRRR